MGMMFPVKLRLATSSDFSARGLPVSPKIGMLQVPEPPLSGAIWL